MKTQTFSLVLLTHSPVYAASLFTQIIAGQGDRMTGSGQVEESDTGQPISIIDYTTTYDLEDPGFAEGSLDFVGQGSASAVFKQLRAASSGTVTNTYFDIDFNDEDGTGFVPIQYGVQSIASYSETLQYGGTATNYNSRYILRFTGAITESDISNNTSFATIALTHGLAPTQSWFFDQPGNYDIILTSNAFVNNPTPQEFSLRLLTSFDVYTDEFSDGSDVSGSAAFGNTLEVIGIDVRDENGNLVAPGTVTGDGSGAYDIIEAVPEPSSLLLLCLTGFGIFQRRR